MLHSQGSWIKSSSLVLKLEVGIPFAMGNNNPEFGNQRRKTIPIFIAVRFRFARPDILPFISRDKSPAFLPTIGIPPSFHNCMAAFEHIYS